MIDLLSNLEKTTIRPSIDSLHTYTTIYTDNMPKKPSLLLVDGSSYMYRAFYALPNLRNSQGEPTGAVYGMVNMLRRLVIDFPESTHRVCVFDAHGKTFRDELYADYKATRSSMPDDMRLQIGAINSIVSALGWHILSVPNVEADDVIGTLSVQASQQGYDTVISTGDKDMAQLVNSNVLIVDTMKHVCMGIKEVEAKFGVLPERIVDYLALIGDISDNIPGVYKCGPKTALNWLKIYGSLDHLMAQSHEIKGVVGEHLRQAIECNQFDLTRQLLRIKCDVDLSMYLHSDNPLDSLKTPLPDFSVQKQLFSQLGFKTWLRELDDGHIAVMEPMPSQSLFISDTSSNRYDIIYTESEFQHWFNRIQKAHLVAIDTETDSLNVWKARLVGLSFCYENGVAAYIPLGHNYPDVPQELPLLFVLNTLKPWLESDAIHQQKILQHAKFDMHIFANYGIQLRGVAHDTLLAAYVIESHKRNHLNALAERYLGKKGITYEDLCGKGVKAITIDQVDISRVAAYAAEDADFTWQVHHAMQPIIQADKGLTAIYHLEIASQPILFEIERTGVTIDSDQLRVQSHKLGKQLLALEQAAYVIANQPFNLNSPKQLGDIMYTQLGYPIQNRTPSGIPSTDEETLHVLVNLLDNQGRPCTLASIILQYRSLAKLKNTYTDPLPMLIEASTGRIHTHYAQAAVITGRLSSSEPNLQNIPIKTAQGRCVRQAFIAPANHQLLSVDYSQIELRIMAHLSQDTALIQAFKNGMDIHRVTAADLFNIPIEKIDTVTNEQRRYAKTINFGLIYGMSAFGLANALGISNSEAKVYIERYFSVYTGVKNYMSAIKLQAKNQGYVSTILGRRIYLPDINANGPKRTAAERAAINAPMQGTAADLIKQAMVDIAHWLKRECLHSKILMQVHDELVLEVPDNELEIIKVQVPQLMSKVLALEVPLIAQVGIGKNWDSAH